MVKSLVCLPLSVWLCLICALGSAQVYNYEDGEEPLNPDSISGLYVGLNLGVYFANSNTARLYNGYGYQRDGTLNDFSNSWLNFAIQGNSVNVKRTGDALGGLTEDEWTFNESDMPGAMHYSPSFMWGGHLRYMFGPDFGAFVELNGSKPVTIGEFTIQRNSPSPNPLENNRLEKFQIRGEEQRLIVNLGLHRVLFREQMERAGKATSLLPYIDLGGSLTFVKFEKNIISLGDLVPPVDLTVFFNQQNQFTDAANLLTGSGLGGFAGLGGQISLGSKFTIDIGYYATMTRITFGEFKDTGLQQQVLFKAIYM